MANSTCNSLTSQISIGADPINIKWNVVRGDTSSLDVQFLEDNEVDAFDISDWSFEATVFDKATSTMHSLDVSTIALGVRLVATPEMTSEWGTGIQSRVSELLFDLQATHTDGTIWTPVIGIVSVLGDVTGGTL